MQNNQQMVGLINANRNNPDSGPSQPQYGGSGGMGKGPENDMGLGNRIPMDNLG